MFWQVVHYGWFVFMGLAVFAVFGGAIWDSTAPKRRLKQIERERLRREKEAAKAAKAAEAAAAASGAVAEIAPAQETAPPAETPAEAPPAVMEDEDIVVVDGDAVVKQPGDAQA
jgi:hypothetical protein